MAKKLTAAEYGERALRDRRGGMMLRAYLTGRAASADDKTRSNISKALTNGKLFSAVLGELHKLYGAYAAAAGRRGGTVLDFAQWLLQWLLDNADKIIAIIVKLIPLFVV